MKKFLLVIIAVALLMSGCNNPELNNSSSSITSSSESGTQINEQFTAEMIGSNPSCGSSEDQSSTEPQHTSTNYPTASDKSVQEPEISSSPGSESGWEISSDRSAESSETSSTIPVSDREPEQSTNKEGNALSIEITVNGRTFSATLCDNETARAFKDMLPLALTMSELNGNEKYYYLPDNLPKNSSRPSRINTGDIMLYGSDCLVIFYEGFSTSYSYTPIGKIDDPDGLAAALGSGSVQVAFN